MSTKNREDNEGEKRKYENHADVTMRPHVGAELTLEEIKSKKRKTCLWDDCYADLVVYQCTHGHCNVSQEDDPRLAEWVSAQRQRRQGSDRQVACAPLHPYQIERLNAIGFVWDEQPDRVEPGETGGDSTREGVIKGNGTEFDKRWMKKYELLLEFKREHGDCLVRHSHKILGQWVGTQRHKNREGSLNSERKKLLDDIEFCWHVHPTLKNDEGIQTQHEKWMQKYEMLLEFKREHGDCLVRHGHKILGGWVAMQRRKNREGSLDSERKKLLDDIEFCWYPTSKKDKETQHAIWMRKYELLSEFKREHGDCRVRRDHKILGTWVKHQRHKNREGSLNSDRKKLLDDIGFCWYPTGKNDEGIQSRHATWMQKYEMLLEFKREHGDCLVRQDHKMLGRWVDCQRQSHQNGKLSSERTKLLDDIGFCWHDKPGRKLRKNSPETVRCTTGSRKLAVERPAEGEAKTSANDGEAKYPVGTSVSKFFERHGWFSGDVTSFDGEYYMITYEDGDKEELNEEDLAKVIIPHSQASEVEIGSRVAVERPGYGQFCKGMVTKQRSGKDSWYVVYDDLSWEWLDLRMRRFHLLPDHECHPREETSKEFGPAVC